MRFLVAALLATTGCTSPALLDRPAVAFYPTVNEALIERQCYQCHEHAPAPVIAHLDVGDGINFASLTAVAPERLLDKAAEHQHCGPQCFDGAQLELLAQWIAGGELRYGP